MLPFLQSFLPCLCESHIVHLCMKKHFPTQPSSELKRKQTPLALAPPDLNLFWPDFVVFPLFNRILYWEVTKYLTGLNFSKFKVSIKRYPTANCLIVARNSIVVETTFRHFVRNKFQMFERLNGIPPRLSPSLGFLHKHELSLMIS